MVLLQLFKDMVKGETQESANSKKNRIVNLLNKILIICNWVQNENPSSINQVFNAEAVTKTNKFYNDLHNTITHEL